MFVFISLLFLCVAGCAPKALQEVVLQTQELQTHLKAEKKGRILCPKRSAIPAEMCMRLQLDGYYNCRIGDKKYQELVQSDRIPICDGAHHYQGSCPCGELKEDTPSVD